MFLSLQNEIESTNNNSIVIQYPYRAQPLGLSLISGWFIIAGIYLIYSPFRNPCSSDRLSGDCSLGSKEMELFNLVFMILLGGWSIIMSIIAWKNYFAAKKVPLIRKVAFTNFSIIGPSSGKWKEIEKEILFSEIKSFRTLGRPPGSQMMIESSKHTIVLKKLFLEKDHYLEIFDRLSRVYGKATQL